MKFLIISALFAGAAYCDHVMSHMSQPMMGHAMVGQAVPLMVGPMIMSGPVVGAGSSGGRQGIPMMGSNEDGGHSMRGHGGFSHGGGSHGGMKPPSWLIGQNISTVKQYFDILRDNTTTIAAQKTAIQDLAASVGAGDEATEAQANMTNFKNALIKNVTDIVNQLPQVISQMQQIMNNEDQTREQQKEAFLALKNTTGQAFDIALAIPKILMGHDQMGSHGGHSSRGGRGGHGGANAHGGQLGVAGAGAAADQQNKKGNNNQVAAAAKPAKNKKKTAQNEE